MKKGYSTGKLVAMMENGDLFTLQILRNGKFRGEVLYVLNGQEHSARVISRDLVSIQALIDVYNRGAK